MRIAESQPGERGTSPQPRTAHYHDQKQIPKRATSHCSGHADSIRSMQTGGQQRRTPEPGGIGIPIGCLIQSGWHGQGPHPRVFPSAKEPPGRPLPVVASGGSTYAARANSGLCSRAGSATRECIGSERELDLPFAHASHLGSAAPLAMRPADMYHPATIAAWIIQTYNMFATSRGSAGTTSSDSIETIHAKAATCRPTVYR